MKKTFSGIIILVAAIATAVVLNQRVLSSAWSGITGAFSHAGTPLVAQDQGGATAPATSVHGSSTKGVYIQPVPIHIPGGNDVFRVAEAATVEPQIVQVDVNPPNVTPGDIQKMYAVVSDPVPIVSVTATIRTDHGTTTVSLSPAGTAPLSELLPQKYYVAKDGTLGFLSSDPKIAAEQLQTAGVAFADTPQLKYVGSWKVKDTHDIYYTTIFTARDAEGRTNSAAIAWRDNCPAFTDNANNTLSTTCTMTYTDGVNGGSITIGSGTTLTLSSGGDLVFNSGYSITVSGSIVISGGEIQQGIIEGTDNDGDGYPGGFTYATSGTDRSKSELDCYDSNANAYPGQTAYFSTVRGSANDAWGNTGNSYDYNCDGSETKQVSSYYTLCSMTSAGSCTTCTQPTCSEGGSTSTPACGQSYNDVICSLGAGELLACSGGTGCADIYRTCGITETSGATSCH